MTNTWVKSLEIKTSMLFNLAFAYNTILLFFLLFVIMDFCILIDAVFGQVFIATLELTMTTKTEIEIHSVTTKAKINNCLK